MPFTLAHPAAVLPLHGKWRGGFLGLVFGSLGPDIPYFLPARLGDSLPKSHDFLGVMRVGAPLALTLLAVTVLGRTVLIEPLWGRVRAAADRTLAGALRSPAAWLHTIAGISVGCEIHLLWDSFTHKEGWMVLHLHVLTYDISPLDGYPLQLFRALQYVSSVVGLLMVVLWCRRRLRWHRQELATERAGWKPWTLAALAIISLIAAWYAVQSAGSRPGRPHTLQYIAATTAVEVFVLLYALFGALLAVARRRRAWGAL
jgi:hypothetical protein